jgi:hypothetical protein
VAEVAVPSEEPAPRHEHPAVDVTSFQPELTVTPDGNLRVQQHCRIEPRGCAMPEGYPRSVALWSKAPLESVHLSEPSLE